MQIIGGKFRNRKLVAPKGSSTRPTPGRLREAIFNICQHYIEDAQFLDLFSGSGAMGLEALSRGAKAATFVESSKEAFRSIQQNAKNLDVEKSCHIIFGDVFQNIKKLKTKFDIIYADPPYKLILSVNQLEVLASHHVIRLIDESDLLKPMGDLFVEESSECPEYQGELKNLELKSCRRKGHSMIQHYQKTE